MAISFSRGHEHVIRDAMQILVTAKSFVIRSLESLGLRMIDDCCV